MRKSKFIKKDDQEGLASASPFLLPMDKFFLWIMQEIGIDWSY
jgi:hypothetical protein